jgi:hypothetical protein
VKTLSINIPDSEFNRLGLPSEKMSIDEFLDIVHRDFTRRMADRTVELAEKYGLSQMTMDEIDEEVKAVRADAKRNR